MAQKAITKLQKINSSLLVTYSITSNFFFRNIFFKWHLELMQESLNKTYILHEFTKMNKFSAFEDFLRIFWCWSAFTIFNISPIRAIPKNTILCTRISSNIRKFDWAGRFEVTSLIFLMNRCKNICPIFTFWMFSTLGSTS